MRYLDPNVRYDIVDGDGRVIDVALDSAATEMYLDILASQGMTVKARTHRPKLIPAA